MGESVEMFLRSLDEFDKRVQATRDLDLDNPTPCSEWNVRALINHLVYEDKWAVPLLAGKTIDEVGDAFEGDLLGDDPQAAWREASEGARSAVQGPGVMDRTVHLSFGATAGGEYLDQLTADHLIHAWDLAKGTNGDLSLDGDLMEHVYGWAAPKEEGLKASGVYGDKVEAPGDADLQTKLLAVFGRRA